MAFSQSKANKNFLDLTKSKSNFKKKKQLKNLIPMNKRRRSLTILKMEEKLKVIKTLNLERINT